LFAWVTTAYLLTSTLFLPDCPSWAICLGASLVALLTAVLLIFLLRVRRFPGASPVCSGWFSSPSGACKGRAGAPELLRYGARHRIRKTGPLRGFIAAAAYRAVLRDLVDRPGRLYRRQSGTWLRAFSVTAGGALAVLAVSICPPLPGVSLTG